MSYHSGTSFLPLRRTTLEHETNLAHQAQDRKQPRAQPSCPACTAHHQLLKSSSAGESPHFQGTGTLPVQTKALLCDHNLSVTAFTDSFCSGTKLVSC